MAADFPLPIRTARLLFVCTACFLSATVTLVEADEPTLPANAAPAIEWRSDYRPAMAQAKAESKWLLIWFADERQGEANAAWQRDMLAQPTVRELLAGYVPLKLSLTAAIETDGKRVELLKHPSFSEMLGSAGLAIVDQRDPESPHFGRIVSVYPFRGGSISADRFAVLLDLPTGTLTQRTMTLAVRTHHLRPQSAWSETSELLNSESENHAGYQASIRLQGHHRWDQRFHQINARLPAGLVANEVCAESWPGQNLVEAAEECVDCWRQSPGHWDHVSRRHGLFGYDMKRGRNGVWYATGIFGTPRR